MSMYHLSFVIARRIGIEHEKSSYVVVRDIYEDIYHPRNSRKTVNKDRRKDESVAEAIWCLTNSIGYHLWFKCVPNDIVCRGMFFTDCLIDCLQLLVGQVDLGAGAM